LRINLKTPMTTPTPPLTVPSPVPAAEETAVCGLDVCAPGTRAIVRRVEGAPGIRRRLYEMGFVAGTPVRVVRLAPLGDPMQIELHGYHISLRRSEARAILVHPA